MEHSLHVGPVLRAYHVNSFSSQNTTNLLHITLTITKGLAETAHYHKVIRTAPMTQARHTKSHQSPLQTEFKQFHCHWLPFGNKMWPSFLYTFYLRKIWRQTYVVQAFKPSTGRLKEEYWFFMDLSPTWSTKWVPSQPNYTVSPCLKKSLRQISILISCFDSLSMKMLES